MRNRANLAGGGPTWGRPFQLKLHQARSGTGKLGPARGGLSLERFKQELGTRQTSHEVTRLEEASPFVIACSKAPSLCLTTAKAFSFEANPNIRVAQEASKLVSSKMQHNTKRHGFENHPASGPPSQAFLTTHRFALFLLGFTFVDATCMCALHSTKWKECNRHAECARSVPPCRPVAPTACAQ